MSDQRPLPVFEPGQVETDVFWSHAQRKELVYQRCAAGHLVFYPRGHCTTCGTAELEVLTSRGVGTIYSFTVTRAHPSEYFAARVPYVVGLVDLDEGFRMLSEISGDIDGIRIGARVRLAWDTSGDLPVPVFILD